MKNSGAWGGGRGREKKGERRKRWKTKGATKKKKKEEEIFEKKKREKEKNKTLIWTNEMIFVRSTVAESPLNQLKQFLTIVTIDLFRLYTEYVNTWIRNGSMRCNTMWYR